MLVALVGGTAVVGTTGVASAKGSTKVAKMATAPALYSITSIKQQAPPPGCVGQGCPSIEQSVPAYAAASGFTSLVGAKKIDTYATNTGNSSTKGGCAISNEDKLLCWGSNTYGQLGDGTTKDSESTPVAAKGIGTVVDVATNGFTTCVVTTSGELKCIGKGSWPGFSKIQTSGNQNEYIMECQAPQQGQTWRNCSEKAGSRTSKNTNECQIVLNEAVVGTTENCWNQSSNYVTNWVTILSSGVSKVSMAGSQGWDNSNICYLSADGKVSCVKVTPGKQGDWQPGQNVNSIDCDFQAGESNPGYGKWDLSWTWLNNVPQPNCWDEAQVAKNAAWATISSYKQRDGNVSKQVWTAATWEWVDSEMKNVVDFAMSEQAWGSDGSVCMIAGTDKSLTCIPFKAVITDGQSQKTTGGAWGTKNTIAGVYNAEKVYMTTFNGQLALCVYAAGTLSCGTASWNGTTMTFPTSVETIAVMEKPISIFSQSGAGFSKAYFMTPSGLLSADSWAFSCSGCQKQSGNILSAVTAFKDATATNSYFIEKMTGATDSYEFIPVSLTTASRKLLSQKAITVKTSAGATLANTDVRWTAPDAPDSLSSSKTAKDVTSSDGVVRLATLPTGPVSFTLRGGTLSDGTYLQAAVVTQVIPESGTVEVIVPVASGVVDRTATVQLTDKTPVPNAVVVLRNNYLTYNYANNGSANSSWSTSAPDTKGFMQQASCAYCFVAPPTYITGADGSVTWKSFVPLSRSSQYDAEVVYDDGSLNQKVRVNFVGTSTDATTTGNSTTVTMPFMANIQTALPDQVAPKADGSVEIPVTMKDGDNLPISELPAKAEEVCGEMQKGGLWSGSSSVQEGFCEGRGPGTSTGGIPGTTSPVSKSGVSSFACAASSSTKTDSKGTATVKICPSKSGYFRVRSSGVLPSKSICVKVNNQPCTVTLQNSIAGQSSSTTSGGTSLTGGTTAGGPAAASAPKSVKAKGKLATSQFLKAFTPKAGAGSTKVTASGACKVVGKSVVAGTKKGVCRVTVTQAAKGKVKGTRKVFTVKVV